MDLLSYTSRQNDDANACRQKLELGQDAAQHRKSLCTGQPYSKSYAGRHTVIAIAIPMNSEYVPKDMGTSSASSLNSL